MLIVLAIHHKQDHLYVGLSSPTHQTNSRRTFDLFLRIALEKPSFLAPRWTQQYWKTLVIVTLTVLNSLPQPPHQTSHRQTNVNINPRQYRLFLLSALPRY